VWKKIHVLFGEWGFKNIIGLHKEKLLNCFVPHYSLSNFQGEKILRKWNQMELGFCCWVATLMTSWLLREDREWCDPLRSKVLYCIVRINKIEGIVIQDVVDFLLILDNSVVTLLKHISSIKDCITKNTPPFLETIVSNGCEM
jgi:hypothetical protein